MTRATVTVRGSATRRVPPTSVVLTGELVVVGGDRQASFDELVLGQQQLAEELGDALRITGVTSVDTEDDRGWKVHRHTAAVELTVDDPGGVGAAVAELVGFGVEVHAADWRIGGDDDSHGEVRRAAVQDAVARAGDYAAAVGLALGPLVSVSDGVAPAQRVVAGGVSPTPAQPGTELSLAPQQVLVAATAEVRFELTDP